MFFWLIFQLFALLNDVDSVQRELNYITNRISNEVDDLLETKTKLSIINPEKKALNPVKIHEEEEKMFMLVSIDTSKADEYQNLNSFKSIFKKKKEICEDLQISWLSESIAPIFTFKPPSLSVARHVVFESVPECQCSIKQLRFEFFHDNKLLYKSKVIDLQNGFSNSVTIDFETDIIFNSFKVNVIQNWGDDFQTCLNRFHIFGPKL